MPTELNTPDESLLRRFLAGDLSGPELDFVAVYLEAHPDVASTLDSLVVNDTLVTALRNAPRRVADSPALASFITSMTDLVGQPDPPLATPVPSESGEMTRTTPTPRDAAHAPTADPEQVAGFDDDLRAMLSPAVQPDEIGRLGRYRVLRVLGRGGMGAVFAAEDDKLKRKVALKVMLPGLAANANARQRFIREAETAAKVEHDNIIPIYDIAEDRGIPFLAMPLLVGETLDDRVKGHRALAISDVYIIGRQIAEGLAGAHAAGLIHRDIKPSNVWLERTASGAFRRVRILDFGLARLARAGGEHLTNTGAVMGTPAYMAPEQARGLAVDHRADLFSLGCVLYQMATGQRPFQGADTFAILTALAVDNPPIPHEVNPHCPQALSWLILRLLAKNPAERWPPTAQQVADELAKLAAFPDAASGGVTHVPAPAVVMIAPPAVQAEDVWSEVANTATEAQADGVPLAAPADAGVDEETEAALAPRRNRAPIWIAASLLFLCFVAVAAQYGGQVIRIATNEGELVIVVDDPTIEVTVKQGTATIVDRSTKREYVLKAGQGEVIFHDPQGGVNAVVRVFEIKRGGKVVLSVTMEDIVKNRKPPTPAKQPPVETQPLNVIVNDLFKGEVFAVVKNDGWIAVSPNGKWLAVPTMTKQEVWLFDTETRKLVHQLKGHTKRPYRIAFSPNNDRVACAGLDGQVLVWEIETGKREMKFKHEGELALSLVFHPNGKQLISGGQTSVRFWNLETEEEEKEKEIRGFSGDLHGLAISPNGKWLAGAAQDNKAFLWNLETGIREHLFENLPSRGSGVAFSPDSRVLAIGSNDEGVTYLRVWSLSDRKMLTSKDGIGGWWLAFAPDSKSVWTGPWNAPNGSVITRFTLDGKLLARFEYPGVTGYPSFTLSKDGGTLYVGPQGYDKGIVACDSATGKPKGLLSGTADEQRAALQAVLDLGGRVVLCADGQADIEVPPGTKLLPNVPFDSAWVQVPANLEFTDAVIEKLRRLPRIHRLLLAKTRINGEALKKLSEMPWASTVGVLELNETGISDDDLVHLKAFTNLFHLHLAETRISGEGFKHFAERAFLSTLDLRGCKMFNPVHLAELRGKNIAVLHLTDCPELKDEHLAALKEYTNLGTLSLSDTGITDGGLVYLQAVASLRWLSLDRTKVTRPGMLKLSDANPELAINTDNGAAIGPKVLPAIQLSRQNRLGPPGMDGPLPGLVGGLAFTDAKTLLEFGSDDQVITWSRDTGRPIATRTLAVPDMHRCTPRDDGKVIAVYRANRSVEVRDTSNGKLLAELGKAANMRDAGMPFSRDGKLLALTHDDMKVRVWDWADRKVILETEPVEPGSDDPPNQAAQIAFTPNGEYLVVVAHYTSRIQVYNLKTAQLAASWVVPRGDTLEAGQNRVTALAISPDGKTMAAGHRQVMLWELPGGKRIGELPYFEKYLYSLAFSPNGAMLAAGCHSSGRVEVWDIATRKSLCVLHGFTGEAVVAFDSDSKVLAVGSNTARVAFFDPRTGFPLHGPLTQPSEEQRKSLQWILDIGGGFETRRLDGKNWAMKSQGGTVPSGAIELRTVWVGVPEFTDADIPKLAALPAIRHELKFNGSKITDAGISTIAALPNAAGVNQIVLTETAVTKAGAEKLAAALSQARIIYEGGTIAPGSADPNRAIAEWVISVGGYIQVEGMLDPIDVSDKLPKKRFALSTIILANAKGVDDEALTRLGTLKEFSGGLNLKNTGVTDAGLKKLAGFPGLAKLSLLVLDGTEVTAAGIEQLAGFKHLLILSLPARAATPEMVKLIRRLPSLYLLGFHGPELTDAALAGLKGSDLTGLSLSNCPKVTDAGMEHVAGLAKLNSLALIGSGVTERGLEKLAGLRQLDTLTLLNSPISDSVVDVLKRWPQLIHLDLRKTKMTEAGVKQLAAALPKCSIIHDGGFIEPKP